MADDTKALLDRLEEDLNRLKHEYDLFFAGKRQGEPMKERRLLESRLLAESRRAIVGNSDQLRFNNLSTRYFAFANLWTRIVRDLEEGRAHRDPGGTVARTRRHRIDAADPEHVARTADALMEARRNCGLNADPADLSALRESLRARAEEISASAGGKRVEFQVSVEDGKPKLKAVLR